MGFLIRLLINAAAIWVAASLIPGIDLGGLGPTILAALVLGLINAIVRPILVVLTFPITLLTLGLFLLVLNAFCLWLVAVFVSGFHVAGFWPAFWGALLVSIVSWILTALISDSGRVRVVTRR